MAFGFVRTARALTLAGVATVALVPIAASAQDSVAKTGPVAAEPQDQTSAQTSDIIVTGTLVRGVAPPGASPITVDEAAIGH